MIADTTGPPAGGGLSRGGRMAQFSYAEAGNPAFLPSRQMATLPGPPRTVPLSRLNHREEPADFGAGRWFIIRGGPDIDAFGVGAGPSGGQPSGDSIGNSRSTGLSFFHGPPAWQRLTATRTERPDLGGRALKRGAAFWRGNHPEPHRPRRKPLTGSRVNRGTTSGGQAIRSGQFPENPPRSPLLRSATTW